MSKDAITKNSALKSVFLFIVILYSNQLAGQCDTLRYQKAVFENVIAHNDVKYGEAQVWSIPYNNTDLFMDIYEPEGDTLSKRPLMLWVHPGGFLTGDKTADDMVALCDSFARRGYVTASIGYRLGFNPTSQASGERAVYRGTQDMRAAIRFLKEYREEYRIDTNYTFLGGSSAGGFAALHTAYLEQHEAPNSITGGIASPDLGCLDCSGNEYQHGINLSGIVNLWGAIGDSTWVNDYETVPALLIHGTEDGVVPYGVGHPFGVFTTPLTHGSRCVSNQLDSHGIPHRLIAFEGEDHEPHGTSNGTFNDPPTPYWDTIFEAIDEHYFSIIQPKDLTIQGPDEVCKKDTIQYTVNTPTGGNICVHATNGSVIEVNENSFSIVWNESGEGFFDLYIQSSILASSNKLSKSVLVRELPEVAIIAQGGAGTYSFQPSPTGFTNYLWNFGDGNVATSMGPTHTYNDGGEFTVSLRVTDEFGCRNTTDTTINVSLLSIHNPEQMNIDLYPNPSSDQFFIESTFPIEGIRVYDVLGKAVYQEQKQSNSYVISTKYWTQGTYFVEIHKEGASPIRKKIVIAH